MERPEDRDRPMAIPTRQLETDRAVVTMWRFPPGAHTGWHRHGHDYVVVPTTSGSLAIWDGVALSEAAMTAGASYCRAAGVEHDVINPGPGEFSFVEIEFKP